MKISDRGEIGERIRSVRMSKNLTQEQIANNLGVSKVSVSLWERGATALSAESLIQIADFLTCSPVWIMTGEASTTEQAPGMQLELDHKLKEILRLLEMLPESEKDNTINTLKEKNNYYQKLFEELKTKRE